MAGKFALKVAKNGKFHFNLLAGNGQVILSSEMYETKSAAENGIAEIVKTLNTVVPYNWQDFFNERVYKVQNHAPLGGITNGGWKLVYNDTPNLYMESNSFLRGTIDLSYSLGIILDNQGLITDINPDLPAAKAGLAPGMTITKANKDKDKGTTTIEVENGGFKETYTVNSASGVIYPHLVRDESKPDLLSEVVKSAQKYIFFPPWTSRNKPVVKNTPADITNVLLSQTDVIANCPTNPSVCSDSKRTVEVLSEAVDPEKDGLTYHYTVTAGKVIGTDAKVVWDLTGVKAGTYTITAAVDDGCGFCGKTMTKTVVVRQCPDCKP